MDEPGRTAAPSRVSETSSPDGLALLGRYHPLPGVPDEMMDGDGRVRDHWQPLLDCMAGLSAAERDRRRREAQQLIHDHGVTYNVYGDPQGFDRPWKLDLTPLILPAEEWSVLSRGLIQRAHLLNAVLADLYGPRDLLSGGALAPEILFANPQYLRPLSGHRPPGDRWLHLMAVDLARGPDGRWWVLSDRTQAPSGAGYALENRVIAARTWPEPFRRMPVARLAGFFEAWRAGLSRLSGKDEPRLVLLTPGPYNETYFEHAYLARHLGVPLVEGADLTVRDGRVFLKAVDGLKPVDVVIRRLDSEWCDPLELRNDSSLGIPGLLEAVRGGTVVVANALGSGVVEAAALLAFLPGLCRAVLGQDLLLPSTATWWCGDPAVRSEMLAKLDRMVLQPAFSPRRMPGAGTAGPAIGSSLDPAARTRLERDLVQRGWDRVGQELVALSTAPSWVGDRMRPAPMSLRVFIAWDGDGYRVMPGGLTRVSASHDTRAVSMQRGDGSKDTWVLADGDARYRPPRKATDMRLAVRRTMDTLPSRSADDLFWLGRYAERAETRIRLFRAVIARLTGEAWHPRGSPVLARLIDRLVLRLPDGLAADSTARFEAAVPALLFDRTDPSSLAFTQRQLQHTARNCRDRLGTDAWRLLTDLQPGDTPEVGITLDGALLHLKHRQDHLVALAGLQQEATSRGHGWRFTDLGRRLERIVSTAELLATLATEPDGEIDGGLETALELGVCAMTYRTRYGARLQQAPVVDLLLADPGNPRSIAFQLAWTVDHIDSLPRDDARGLLAPDQRLARGLLADVTLCDVEHMLAARHGGDGPTLRGLLDHLLEAVPRLSDMIGGRYFLHSDPRQVRRPNGADGITDMLAAV